MIFNENLPRMLFCVIMGRVRSQGRPLLCNYCVIIHSNVTIDNSRAKVFHHSMNLKDINIQGLKTNVRN